MTRYRRSGPVHSISFSNDGEHLISATDDGWLDVRKSEDCERVFAYRGCLGGIEVWAGPVCAWMPILGEVLWGIDDRTADGRPFFQSPQNGTFALQRGRGPLNVGFFRGHQGFIRDCAIRKEGNSIFVLGLSNDGFVRKWNLFTQGLQSEVEGSTEWRFFSVFGALALSPDGSLAACDYNGKILVWDLDRNEVFHMEHSIRATHLGCTFLGGFIVSAFAEGVVLWEVEKRRQLCVLRNSEGFSDSLSVASDVFGIGLPALIAASKRNHVKLWDGMKNEVIGSFHFDYSVHACAVSQNCRYLAVGDEIGNTHIMEIGAL